MKLDPSVNSNLSIVLTFHNEIITSNPRRNINWYEKS
jgi:hypothetical protein